MLKYQNANYSQHFKYFSSCYFGDAASGKYCAEVLFFYTVLRSKQGIGVVVHTSDIL